MRIRELLAVSAVSLTLLVGSGCSPQHSASISPSSTPSESMSQASLDQMTANVTIDYRGEKKLITGFKPGETIDQIIKSEGLSLDDHDQLSKPKEATPATGETIIVTNVYSQDWEETRDGAAPSVNYIDDATLDKGVTKTLVEGSPAKVKVELTRQVVNGVPQPTQQVKEEQVAPKVDKQVAVGSKPVKASTTPSASPSSPAPSSPAPTTTPTSSQPTQSPQQQAPVSSPVDPANSSMWDRIAQCESGGNWGINTGNGYYGGLQFNLSTWLAAGGGQFAHYPNQATREQQITIANRLYAQRGLQPWSCKP